MPLQLKINPVVKIIFYRIIYHTFYMGNVVNDENVIKGYILSLDNCCSQIYDLKIKNDLIVKIAYHVDNYVNSKKTMFTLDNVLTWFKNLTYSHKV